MKNSLKKDRRIDSIIYKIFLQNMRNVCYTRLTEFKILFAAHNIHILICTCSNLGYLHGVP